MGHEQCFAGVDWASQEHAICVVDENGRIVAGRRYRHDEAGIQALCGRLLRLEVARVAIERPDGLLIERLLDAGLTVVAVHPNQVVAMRPRYSVAGGKSDGFDSFVLAELARTDSHRFRVLEPDGDQTKALRALTRAREGLRPHPGRAGQPAARPARVFLAGCCERVLQRRLADRAGVPEALPITPPDARGLGEQRLQAFLERNGYPGRKPARELLKKLPPALVLTAALTSSSSPPAGRSCSRSSPPWSRSSLGSAS